MAEHEHAPHEYCDQCRPVLECDFGAGEQFWRHWSSPDPVLFPDGRKARIKVLSKKTVAGSIEFVCLREFEDRSKEIFGGGSFGRDDQLVAFVGGVDLIFKSIFRDPPFVLAMVDFRDCNTIEKWEYKMREGTDNFEVWNDPEERPRKEEGDGDPGHRGHDPERAPEEGGKDQPDSPPRPPGEKH